MRYRLSLMLIVLSLTLILGCESTPFSNIDGPTTEMSETLPVSEPLPFDINRDNIAKVTIYIGSDELLAEITDAEDLNPLLAILENSASFPGDAPADLNNTIVIESLDGTKSELVVTGAGYVFIDQTTKMGYELDNRRFLEFLKKLQKSVHEG